jgi:hypothetical protein
MRIRTFLGAAILGAVAVIACGSAGKKGFEGDPAGTGGTDAGPTLGEGGPTLGGGNDSGANPSCAAAVTTAKRAEVDLIILIDTSGSMAEETAQVQQNINDFAKSIGQSGLDYRVVMIAEKPFPFPIPIPTGICVPPPLAGASCADNPPLFHHINQTVASTDSLSLILSTYDQWKAYLRADAYKVFIEITDDNSDLDHASFDTQLLAKQPAGIFGDATKRKYIFDAICGWQDGTPILDPTKCSTAVNTGDQYQNLSQLTGGTVDSVCKTSYASVFNNLAKGLVTKLGCDFSLPTADGGTIDPDKVVVQYTPGSGPPKILTHVTDESKCAANPDGWYYDHMPSPSKIVFCAALCSTAGVDTSGKVEILAGCSAPPPK